VWAQAELRKVLAATGARVVDGELAVGRAHTRLEDGALRDEELLGRLRGLLSALVEEAAPTAAAA
jgi:chromate reductase, NAD(P)H dehydrogenase (quinone)